MPPYPGNTAKPTCWIVSASIRVRSTKLHVFVAVSPAFSVRQKSASPPLRIV
jgi:hypothetical protein